MNDEVMKKVAAAEMRGKKMELEALVRQLFNSGIIPDSARNRFLINLAIFCVKAITRLTKLNSSDNVNLL